MYTYNNILLHDATTTTNDNNNDSSSNSNNDSNQTNNIYAAVAPIISCITIISWHEERLRITIIITGMKNDCALLLLLQA